MSVIFEESKEKLIEGVNLIANAVKTTYGPYGKNVFIRGESGLHVTKDGATVARYVSHHEPEVEMGVELVRNIATKTADDVGDGTTTSTILAQEIVNSLKSNEEHPIEVSRKLQEDVKKVVNLLSTYKKEIISKEDLVKVATISTNNDVELGTLIGETYYKVGKGGVVYVEEGTDIETSVDFTEGISIESGMASPFFINTEQNECVLENVLIWVSEYKLDKPAALTDIANRAIREGKSLLIIAPKSDSSIISNLLMNSESGQLKSCLMNTPSHGRYRDLLLKDIKNNIGEYCEKVVISLTNSIFVGGKKSEDCDSEISLIKRALANKDLSKFEKNLHTKRLANYSGGIATINVGGFSAVEVKEKKDRVDDAICAVKAAYQEGVLPGGGISLIKSGLLLSGELHYLNNVLDKPYMILKDSANIKDTYLDIDNFWEGTDLETKTKKDFYELGVLDPFLVTKISLENAVSAASLVLTSGCSIF